MPPENKTPNNSDIDQALKEFEAKSAPQAAQTSEIPAVPKNESGVSFETDSYRALKFYNETDAPKMIKAVMKLSGGAIKKQKTAEYVLLAFVIIAMAVSIYLFLGGINLNKTVEKEPINLKQPLSR